jgi:rSAM/selenodomain-associated transferase 1
MKKALLIVFTKNPKLGKVKTRLAASVGDEKALRVYQFLLDHTFQITRHLEMDKAVYYSDFMPANDVWKKYDFKQFLQTGSDFGAKMSNAFRAAFIRGYEKVVLIGSDCYELNEKEILEAFEKLETKQVVVGPAADGGYYLIGMDNFYPTLFENKNWSTASVFNDTFQNIVDLNLTSHYLQELSDIDDLKDLMKHEDLFTMM